MDCRVFGGGPRPKAKGVGRSPLWANGGCHVGTLAISVRLISVNKINNLRKIDCPNFFRRAKIFFRKKKTMTGTKK
jgi:hypothetical protein